MAGRLDMYDLALTSPHAITASTRTGFIAIESAPDPLDANEVPNIARHG
jgi:hypothetical protein